MTQIVVLRQSVQSCVCTVRLHACQPRPLKTFLLSLHYDLVLDYRMKGGIKLQKEESDEEEKEEERKEEEEDDNEEEEVEVTEDTSEKKEKARIDEIWAMFKTDVGKKSDCTLTTPTTTTAVDTDKVLTYSMLNVYMY